MKWILGIGALVAAVGAWLFFRGRGGMAQGFGAGNSGGMASGFGSPGSGSNLPPPPPAPPMASSWADPSSPAGIVGVPSIVPGQLQEARKGRGHF